MSTNPEMASTTTSPVALPSSTSADQSNPLQPTTSNPTPTPSGPIASGSTPTPTHPLSDSGDERSRDARERESITSPVPMVHLRVLVISGQSHIFSFEPEVTVGRMKELIWSMWPSDWTAPAQPQSPSWLRVLYAGRILSDDSTLGSNNLPTALSPTIPTVIHLSVRSFSIRNEDDPKKNSLIHPTRSRSRNQDEEVGGCKCVVQ